VLAARGVDRRVTRVVLTVVAALAGLILVLLVVAQLVLPSVAAERLRDELSAHGRVTNVGVHAFPAVKLLWDSADSVTVTMSELHSDVRLSGDLLARAHETGKLDVRIAAATVGPLAAHDVRVLAHDGRVDAHASVSEGELRAALPPGLDVQPVASGGGQLLLRGSASLFGVGISADALLSAQAGNLVIQPVGLPLASLARLTVFADPRIAVDGVGASAYPGGFTFTVSARLRA
jgi:hypothetical protein